MTSSEIPDSTEGLLLLEERLGAMSRIVREKHAAQTRHAGLSPYWHHCEAVSETLGAILLETGELSGEDLLNIELAGMGHDLYEDTDVDREMIREQFGSRVHDLIQLNTNEQGDSDRSQYVKKMTQAPEEARLIKLSDLLDNYSGGSLAVYTEGVKWVREFLMPILDEMFLAMRQTKFEKYPKTASRLFFLIEFASMRLHNVVKKMNE